MGIGSELRDIKCGVCGATYHNTTYDPKKDIVKVKCTDCGNEWDEKPLNKRKKTAIEREVVDLSYRIDYKEVQLHQTEKLLYGVVKQLLTRIEDLLDDE